MKNQILIGDCRETLGGIPPGTIQSVVTSIPYWNQRDYQADGQIGLEKSMKEHIRTIVSVFDLVSAAMRDDGTVFLNVGDHYRDGQRAGYPHRLAFAMQRHGWVWRDEIIWYKRNPIRESATNRTCKAHEYVFLFTKSKDYFSDFHAIRTKPKTDMPNSFEATSGHSARHDDLERHGLSRGNKNNRACAHPLGSSALSVWDIPVVSYRGAHFATFPERFAERCVKAGTSERGRCPECGKCWVRVLEAKREPTRPGRDNKNTGDRKVDGNRDPGRHVTEYRTAGWKPGCECPGAARPVPCLVLDPFFGAGTVGVVAKKLRRHWIGCELNPAYAALAAKRIAKATAGLTGVG